MERATGALWFNMMALWLQFFSGSCIYCLLLAVVLSWMLPRKPLACYASGVCCRLTAGSISDLTGFHWLKSTTQRTFVQCEVCYILHSRSWSESRACFMLCMGTGESFWNRPYAAPPLSSAALVVFLSSGLYCHCDLAYL